MSSTQLGCDDFKSCRHLTFILLCGLLSALLTQHRVFSRLHAIDVSEGIGSHQAHSTQSPNSSGHFSARTGSRWPP